ncbi:MAG: hypothetical protein IT379_15885 [Deltaproteobacteria bacterium]|nr:hypothetical protein [Deltaproteobacteria bacterium]
MIANAMHGWRGASLAPRCASSARRVVLALAGGALIGSCGSALPPLPAPLDHEVGVELSGPARDRAVEDLRRAEQRPVSFVAEHVLDAYDLESGRGGRLQGALAVARPDRFRLRSIGPAGLTVLDLVYRGGAYRATTAGGREVTRGRVGRGPSPRGVPVDAIARAFLSRLEGTTVVSVRETRRARVVVLRDRERDELRVAIARRGSDVLEERSLRARRERLRLRYADHRVVRDGVRLPFRVTWTQSEPALRATIVVRRYVIEPRLPAAAFDL